MKEEKPSNETLNAWHKDPDNWKLGIFYYHKIDKRIFTPKRIRAFEVTINFANPYSILAFLGIILVIVFISKYTK